jgi:hypothetical protein
MLRRLRRVAMRSTFFAMMTTVTAFMAISAAAADKPVQLSQGPGLDKVEAHCGACHSLDYVLMDSPVLSAAGWDAEVAKMIDAFGAPIDQVDAKTIADYLKRNYAYALLDQIEVRLAGVESPFLKKDKSVPDPLSSNSGIAHHPRSDHGYGLLDQIEARLAGIESLSREKNQRVSERPSSDSEIAHHRRNPGYALLDQIEARLAGIESPSREKDKRVAERPSSNSEIAHHPRTDHGYELLDQIEARLAAIESLSRKRDQGVSERPSSDSEIAHYQRNHGYELLDQIEARLAGIESPSREKDQRVAERPSSNSEIKHERYATKRTQTPRRVTMPWASNHASFERASFESKSTSACPESQSCLGYVPLLLGLGF